MRVPTPVVSLFVIWELLPRAIFVTLDARRVVDVDFRNLYLGHVACDTLNLNIKIDVRGTLLITRVVDAAAALLQ